MWANWCFDPEGCIHVHWRCFGCGNFICASSHTVTNLSPLSFVALQKQWRPITSVSVRWQSLPIPALKSPTTRWILCVLSDLFEVVHEAVVKLILVIKSITLGRSVDGCYWELMRPGLPWKVAVMTLLETDFTLWRHLYICLDIRIPTPSCLSGEAVL